MGSCGVVTRGSYFQWDFRCVSIISIRAGFVYLEVTTKFGDRTTIAFDKPFFLATASVLLCRTIQPLLLSGHGVSCYIMVSDGLIPGTECPECIRLRRELDAALARIAALEAQVRELLAQLGRNSSNSSTPPSADPPGSPKPVVKTPTGRKPAASRASRHHRHRLPPERVKIVVPYLPTVFAHCRVPFPPSLGLATPSRPGIRSPNSPSWRPSSPSTKGTRAPAPAVAASIVPRSPRRFAPMRSGCAWPRWCLTSAAVITSAHAAWKRSSRPSSRCRPPWAPSSCSKRRRVLPWRVRTKRPRRRSVTPR